MREPLLPAPPLLYIVPRAPAPVFRFKTCCIVFEAKGVGNNLVSFLGNRAFFVSFPLFLGIQKSSRTCIPLFPRETWAVLTYSKQ